MRDARPHYLMYTDYATDIDSDNEMGGRWHFVLQSLDGEDYLDVACLEQGVTGERLELLAVVRALESLDQASRITLVTPSRYVSRGLKFGLPKWRLANWRWERFGMMVPIKNGDLWQRVDNALKIHDVNCRRWRLDQSHRSIEPQVVGAELQEQVA